MDPKNIQVDLPEKKEDQEVEAIEKKAEERASRKREQVEKMFIEHYKLDSDSEALKLLVDREMASAQSFDKLIKQKKKWRSMAQEKEDGKKDDKPSDKEGDDPNDKKSDFERIREIEKTKATQEFLQGLVKKYPDKFTDKESVKSAYDKIMGDYKDTGDETRREDFKSNLEKAFRISHPDIYEAEIAEKERKRLLEDDVDIKDVIGDGDKGDKPRERKFFKGTKVDPVKDWYKPKK